MDFSHLIPEPEEPQEHLPERQLKWAMSVDSPLDEEWRAIYWGTPNNAMGFKLWPSELHLKFSFVTKYNHARPIAERIYKMASGHNIEHAVVMDYGTDGLFITITKDGRAKRNREPTWHTAALALVYQLDYDGKSIDPLPKN